MFDEWEEIAHAIEIRKLKCTFGSPKVRCSDDAGGGLGWELFSSFPLGCFVGLFSYIFQACHLSLGLKSLKI